MEKTVGEIESIESIADATLDLLQELGIDKAIFCGLSMGGYVFFEILRKRPGIVLGALLCDTTHEADSDSKRSERSAIAASITEDGLPDFRKDLFDSMVSSEIAEVAPERIERLMELSSDATVEGIRTAQLAMGARKSSEPLLSEIDFPACLIFGRDDAMLPAGTIMHELIPGSSLCILEDCGHFSAIEAPGSFNKILTDFLCENSESWTKM